MNLRTITSWDEVALKGLQRSAQVELFVELRLEVQVFEEAHVVATVRCVGDDAKHPLTSSGSPT